MASRGNFSKPSRLTQVDVILKGRKILTSRNCARVLSEYVSISIPAKIYPPLPYRHGGRLLLFLYSSQATCLATSGNSSFVISTVPSGPKMKSFIDGSPLKWLRRLSIVGSPGKVILRYFRTPLFQES